jgi:hypothetical protein
MYSAVGRPSVPPERLLMALYTVRSERLFCEQLDYNLLFRWFPATAEAPLRSRRGRARCPRQSHPPAVDSLLPGTG